MRRGSYVLLALGAWFVQTPLSGHAATAAFADWGSRPSRAVERPLALMPGQSDDKLREQLKKLTEAMNKRDLEAIRPQISQSRIYVEIADRAGAYLSNSQTLVVMESFFRTRTSITSAFDFVSDDGVNGSASGTLTARKDGHSVSYKLNFGFTKNDRGLWVLTKISMR